MAGTIDKGTIASINTAKQLANVQTKAGIVTTGLVIPWHLRDSSGLLKKGMEVVFVTFDDSTGMILCRADGNWGSFLPFLTIGTTLEAGTDVTIGKSLHLKTHTHPYDWAHDPGSSNTGGPQ